MIYDPFSIVIVPFPFTDKLPTKRRPALVLSHALHQKESNHVTLLMITSAKNSDWISDYPIKQLHSTGLSVPSIIRQKIFTIDSRLIIESAGHLSEDDKREIKNRLSVHLAGYDDTTYFTTSPKNATGLKQVVEEVGKNHISGD